MLSAVLIAPGVLAQVVPARQGGMVTPPPVSGQSYPSTVGAEARANYLRMGMIFSTSYVDNLYAGSGTQVMSETIFSLQPTIGFDATTYRQHAIVNYSPGFTFYTPSSVLNEVDQNANVRYSYRLSPMVTATAQDIFQKSSLSYGPAFSAPGGGISPSGSSSTPGVIAPYAERISNAANAGVSWQFSPGGMIGGTARFFNLHYPNINESEGLYDSAEQGGGGYYAHRITGSQYIGSTYEYSRVLSFLNDAQSETQTDTVYFFYTIYPQEHLSFSISGGPQYYETNQTTVPSAATEKVVRHLRQILPVQAPQATGSQTIIPASSGWSPAINASSSWQGRTTNFAANYAHSVTAGGGLLGTFNSNSANAMGRWQMSRNWIAGLAANYSIIKTVDPGLESTFAGGHTVGGSVTVERPINERFRVLVEYDRLHQSYDGVPALSSNPDSDRVMVSIAWLFSRPIGR